MLVVALLTLAPPSGDAPSHLFQTWLYRHGGFQLWNNLWYAGRYEFVSYSVLYYPLAAHAGELPVLVVSAGVLGACFADVCRREWGSAARNPAIAFACTTPFVSIVSGSYPFTAGAACVALALLALQRGWRVVFSVAVVAALGFSPLAFAVLLSLLAGLLLGHAQPILTARRQWMAIAVVVVALLAGVFLQRAFPSGGIYPYNLTDAVVVVLFSLAGLYVTGSGPRARSLRMLFIAYLILNLTAFLFKSPVGSNATRLFAVAGAPLLWLAANVSRRRSRAVVLPLLAATAALQIGPWIRDAYSAWGSPDASAAYWRPAVTFLNRQDDTQNRVEAVATWGHWEAYYLARAGFPLARGWFRQDDFPENRVLYDHNLTASRVRPLAAIARRALRGAARHDPRLQLRGRGRSAALGALRSSSRVAKRAHEHLRAARLRPDRLGAGRRACPADPARPLRHRLLASRPGSYLVRMRYTPYWEVHGGVAACVSRGPDGMTEVRTPAAGLIELGLSPSVETVGDAVTGASSGCRAAAS